MQIHSHTITQTKLLRPHLVIIIFILMLVSGLALQSIGAWQDSQTTDEAVHLVAGYSYWKTTDFRLNPEHPPLIKLLAAAPLLAVPHLNWSTDMHRWKIAQSGTEESALSQWALGADFLYRSGQTVEDARLLLWLARLPMIVMWAVLAWFLFFWAKQRWGAVAGLVTSAFFIFDPNFLGHGHLVTTDVGVTLGFAATIWATDRFVSRPAWSNWILLAGIFSLTLLTKFSAIILWLIVPLLIIIRLLDRHSAVTWAWWWRMLGGLIVISGLTTWAMYGFEARSIADDPSLVYPPQAPLAALTHVPIPAYSYWRGIAETAIHNDRGHPAYLLGQVTQFGWWYYFPLAMLMKTPGMTLLMFFTALIWQARRLIGQITIHRKSVRWWSVWLFVLPPTIYLLWSFTSHINIGVRHVFPIYPFIYLAIGSLVSFRWSYRWFRWSYAMIAAVGILVITAITAWPHTIGYFSGLFGGTSQAPRYLLDSNLDWNQDVWRLRQLMRQESMSSIHIVPFSWIPIEEFFPETLPMLTDEDIQAGRRPSGVMAIRVSHRYWPGLNLTWLHSYEPKWRVGASILVYDFR